MKVASLDQENVYPFVKSDIPKIDQMGTTPQTHKQMLHHKNDNIPGIKHTNTLNDFPRKRGI